MNMNYKGLDQYKDIIETINYDNGEVNLHNMLALIKEVEKKKENVPVTSPDYSFLESGLQKLKTKAATSLARGLLELDLDNTQKQNILIEVTNVRKNLFQQLTGRPYSIKNANLYLSDK